MADNKSGSSGQRGSGGNFANDRERASEAGRKGGQQNQGGGGQQGRSGNFSEDRERASEAGRKGGEHNHGGERSGNR